MTIYEARFCKICETMYGEDGCECIPPGADLLNAVTMQYFEITQGDQA